MYIRFCANGKHFGVHKCDIWACCWVLLSLMLCATIKFQFLLRTKQPQLQMWTKRLFRGLMASGKREWKEGLKTEITIAQAFFCNCYFLSPLDSWWMMGDHRLSQQFDYGNYVVILPSCSRNADCMNMHHCGDLKYDYYAEWTQRKVSPISHPCTLAGFPSPRAQCCYRIRSHAKHIFLSFASLCNTLYCGGGLHQKSVKTNRFPLRTEPLSMYKHG